MSTKTIIESNGSKWYGQEPDTIEVLKDKLKHFTLDPRFEEFGNFIELPCEIQFIKPCPEMEGLTLFSGNFFLVSHVFRVWTNDEKLISELTELIRANQERQQYKDAKRC